MQTKNAKAISPRERAHMERVKEGPCAVCGQAGPVEAHHIEQGLHYITVALCFSCHRDQSLGWHGQKRMWAIHKMDELKALNETLRRMSQ